MLGNATIRKPLNNWNANYALHYDVSLMFGSRISMRGHRFVNHKTLAKLKFGEFYYRIIIIFGEVVYLNYWSRFHSTHASLAMDTAVSS